MKIKIISRERDSTGWQLFGMGHLKVKPPIGITGSLYLAIPKRAATAAREGILMVVSLVMPCLNQRGEKTPTQAELPRLPIRQTAWAKRQYNGSDKVMKKLKSFLKGDLFGVHLAVNIFIATTVLWLLLRLGADTSPIWAISAMIPALDPQMKQAVTNFRGRIFNALLGCATGLLFLLVGGTSEWKLPLALSATVLLSSYVIRIPAMWRQAPITAAIIIAAGLTHHSKLSGIEIGLRRVGEVMLGCVMGLLVSWLMSKIWPLPESENKQGAIKPSSP